jgi:hypothetical protein
MSDLIRAIAYVSSEMFGVSYSLLESISIIS